MRVKLAIIGASLLIGACSGGGEAGNASVDEANLTDTVATAGEPPAETVYCAAVEQTVEKADCDDIEAARGQVTEGVAAFNVPDPMRRGQSVSVQLVVDRRSPLEIAAIEAPDSALSGGDNAAAAPEPGPTPVNGTEDTVVMNMGSGPWEASGTPENPEPTPKQITDELPGTTETFTPDVGRFMSAELTGQGFKIEPSGPQSKEIPRGGQQSWVWEVTAQQAGRRTLTLTTVVEAVVNGKRYPLDPTLEVRTVTVEVSWLEWMKEIIEQLPGWIKGIAAVLSALTVLLGAWYGFKAAARGKAAG